MNARNTATVLLLALGACASPREAATQWVGPRVTRAPTAMTAALVPASPSGGASGGGGSAALAGPRASAPPPINAEVAGGEARAASPSFEDSEPSGRGRSAGSGAAVAQGAAPAAQEPGARPVNSGTERGWQRATAAQNSMRLSVGDSDTLPLRGAQLRVQVDGFRARVVVDAYYENDRGRSYEGTFQLRLPEGASPYFFAFGETTFAAPAGQQLAVPFFPAGGQDAGLAPEELLRQRAPSWNSPREARMVPRERAALAYTETVRRRVDPALMEWSGAGVFEGRVFPLVAGRVHRVTFGYDVNLERASDGAELALALPPEAANVVVDLSVARSAGAAAPTVEPAAQASSDSAYWRYRFTRPAARTLRIRTASASPVLVGTDVATGSYVAARVAPTIPAAPSSAGASERAVFLLDTSASTQPEQMNTWARLLQSVLTENRASLRAFNVLFFDVSQRWWRQGWVENNAANVAALGQEVEGLALEGATNLARALRSGSNPEWNADRSLATWDTFVLSDGGATWGETDAARMVAELRAAHRGRVFAYTLPGVAGDRALLQAVTAATGGGVFSVSSDAELARAATAHRQGAWMLRAARLAGVTDLLLEGRPTTVYPGQVFTVAGRGTLAPQAALELDLELGAQRVTVQTHLASALSSSLAPRVYGQLAVQQLEERALENAATRAYATHFRVVGRSCSLVMLESEADYQRFGIVPQQEAAAVRASRLAPLLEDAPAPALANPRARFLSWLERLPSQPGVQLTLSRELRDAVAQMPPSSFDVGEQPFDRRQRARSQLPGAYAQQLAQAELDYDLVSAEAERRRAAVSPADGVVALSSLVERRPGDAVLARDVAFTVAQWGLPAESYHLLRRVAEARPFEGHTYRSLAETLAAAGNNDLAMVYFEVGMLGEWGARSRDFKTIVGVEYLHFLREVARGARRVSVPDFARARLPTLEQTVGLERSDVVVMIAWNTDETDIDLHVREPTGEECYYGHRQTGMGGYLTQDVTTGYGPEMYILRNARPGAYRIFVHFFSNHQSRSSARTRVQATVVRHWGTPQEQLTQRVLTLRQSGEDQDIETLAWTQ